MKKLLIILIVLQLFVGCTPAEPVQERQWHAGFASASLTTPPLEECYIAGYHNGNRPTGQLDAQTVSALWLDDGVTSLLLIAVDCVGVDSGTVSRIREALSDFAGRTGCDSVNVISSHTHAGVDTLGLWGPVGLNGKNEEFIEQITAASAICAENAYTDRSAGQLLYGISKTENMQRDSRDPQVFDENLYQFRFIPENSDANGIRLISYAAHAESLRGDNLLISADYPAVVHKLVKDATGDDVMYVPGAIGGLIMTRKLVDEDMVANLNETGRLLAEYVLSPDSETTLEPNLKIARQEFSTPLENTLFLYYKFLGILGNSTHRTLTGYEVETEVSVIRMDGAALALIPGELFPELVVGTGRDGDPEGLASIARRYGIEHLVIAGLANDEIGYIVPPSVFLLDENAPYVVGPEGHYEETNSVSPQCAPDLAAAFENCLRN